MRWTWCLLFALTSGCASKAYFRYMYEPASLPATQPTVLLHPTVVRNGLPIPPEADLAAVDADLAARFRAAGYVVDTSSASLSKLKDLTAALPQPGTLPLAESLATLGAAGACDLVVFPTVELRECIVSGGDCVWDGVIRRMPSDDAVVVMEGLLPATSIAVHAYGCAGTEVLESMGGLEVLVASATSYSRGQTSASPTSGTGVYTVKFVQRSDYLGLDTVRAEAVSLALHPLIAMEGYPSKPKFYDTALAKVRPPVQRKKKKEIFRGKTTK